MSNKYTDGLDQRYIQNFQGKDDDGNVKGSFGSSDRGRYDAYAKATKGLDKDLAFKALDGGMTFGDSDRARYDKLVSDRDSAAKAKAQADAKAQAAARAKAQAAAKAKAQAHQQSSSIVKTTKTNSNVSNTPEPRPSVSNTSNTGSYEKAIDKAKARINSQQPKPSASGINTSQQQTVTQDNDINTNINGNQNTVVNNQDNSIRQYGGNTKVFNYQGGGNSGVDTPVSAATMSGFYDTDDSPAATAKFFDLHNTLFQDAQKKFSTKGTEISSKYSNFDARGYDAGKLDSRIENSKLRSYDRAILAKNDLFGDQDRYRGHLSEYKFGKGPDPIENK